MRIAAQTLRSTPSSDRRVGQVHFDDVVAARRRLASVVTPTPLVAHPLLSRRLGAEAYIKLENASPHGSFRIRGGLNLLASLTDGERARGLVKLLWRIGMTHTTPETDWQGHFVLSSQVWTTARDLARLALLHENDGVWNGERLLPEGWARYVATPAPVQPDDAVKGDEPGYGAYFWLYGPKQGLPAGSYAMRGNRGQSVMIIPPARLIVVRRGFDKERGAPFDAARFSADLLAALR